MATLVTFSVDSDAARPGALRDGRVLDLTASHLPAGDAGDLSAIVRGGEKSLKAVRDAVAAWEGPDHALDAVRLHAPLAHPPKVIGIGLNYIDHCHEAGLDVPDRPVVFTKHSTSVNGPYDDILWRTDVCREVDYEVELGVVIGRPTYRVTESEALGCVFGYCTVNDVSARDVQLRPPGQWDLGKSFDTFCPFGPGIVTADEIPDPQALDLGLKVNGEQKQSSNTKNMIFSVAALIAYLSRGVTLLPGDLIATGTPFGVGLGMKPPTYLKDGDVCEAEIERIGAIRNRVRAVTE